MSTSDVCLLDFLVAIAALLRSTYLDPKMTCAVQNSRAGRCLPDPIEPVDFDASEQGGRASIRDHGMISVLRASVDRTAAVVHRVVVVTTTPKKK